MRKGALRVVPWLRPRVSDQGTTLRATDLNNARATILNPLKNHAPTIQLQLPQFPFFLISFNKVKRPSFGFHYFMKCSNYSVFMYSALKLRWCKKYDWLRVCSMLSFIVPHILNTLCAKYCFPSHHKHVLLADMEPVNHYRSFGTGERLK